MKRLAILLAVMAWCLAAKPVAAQNYGIVFGELEVTDDNAADIFGDGMASYDPLTNVLLLQDGFDYHLSHGLVTINTNGEFRIKLLGDALMAASVECGDPLVVMAEDEGYLKITSNISGSALKCPSLHVTSGVFLDLLSRNSQQNMYALNCVELTVLGGKLHAEVTTADLAVKVQEMNLYGSWLQKPRGGDINDAWGGICFADGLPAKQVRITYEGFGIDEISLPDESASVKKVMENGHLIIIKDGQRYDITGRKLN